ncbi:MULTISPECIES: mechanosensitive ion channel family protein [unclassified Legionella]|uniref:mechanosensitive ion channel family protein n=1 Tax=unclassified Legionella TaxID=2622702 RepID=UPI001056D270|nr:MULTISPECIES: mechanosensitive ion channel family protein [unclassified Legionella]MDI9817836.1 mechanosensitive ion channel family protein [Legionella sp. PL877]
MQLFDPDKLLHLIYAVSLFSLGYLVSRRIASFAENTLGKHFSRHQSQLLKRFLFYGLYTVFFIASLQQLGFKLGVLLGAAGIFTIAISFASQTAASNLISGIFLLFEQPFKIGDALEVKGINGVVDSIDLLSTKLKTPDNKLVRIPNETLIKSEITNLSYFATRRIDLIIGVAYECDIAHVKSMLMAIAESCDKVLQEPAPYVTIDNFANSTVELKFMIWVNTADVSTIRNILQEKIKQQFDDEGIEIPLPQATIHRA